MIKKTVITIYETPEDAAADGATPDQFALSFTGHDFTGHEFQAPRVLFVADGGLTIERDGVRESLLAAGPVRVPQVEVRYWDASTGKCAG